MANINRNDGIIISWGEAIEEIDPEFNPRNGKTTHRRFKARFGVGEPEIRTIFVTVDEREITPWNVPGGTPRERAESLRAQIFAFVEAKLKAPRLPENNEHFLFKPGVVAASVS